MATTQCVSPRSATGEHAYITTRHMGTHCQHCGMRAPQLGRMVGVNHYARVSGQA
jgi:hypothetical protein